MHFIKTPAGEILCCC